MKFRKELIIIILQKLISTWDESGRGLVRGRHLAFVDGCGPGALLRTQPTGPSLTGEKKIEGERTKLVQYSVDRGSLIR